MLVVVLVVVLLLFIWLKLCIWPAVAFGCRCVEGSILFCVGRVSKVAKTIEGLEFEAQRKRGSKSTRTADSRPSSLPLLPRASSTTFKTPVLATETVLPNQPPFRTKTPQFQNIRDNCSGNRIDIRTRVFRSSPLVSRRGSPLMGTTRDGKFRIISSNWISPYMDLISTPE